MHSEKILAISELKPLSIGPDDILVRILRKIRYRCRENLLVGEITVILTSDLTAILESVEAVRKLGRHQGRRLSFLVDQFTKLLLESGAIIRTNCPSARHIFDDTRFESLILAMTTGQELTANYDLQTRLDRLLRLESARDFECPTVTETEEGPDTKSPEPILDDLPTVNSIVSLKDIVSTTIFESIGNLAEKFPVFENACREITNLAEAASANNPDQAKTCTLSLGEQLRRLVTVVEDAALELLSAEKPPEKIIERTVSIPVFDESALTALEKSFADQQQILQQTLTKLREAVQPPTRTIDPFQEITDELARLEREKTRLVPALESIRTQEQAALEVDEDLSEQIETIQQKLKYEDSIAQKNMRTIVEEATRRQLLVQEHLDRLQKMRQPVTDTLEKINKRLNILHASQHQFILPEITLPELPPFDISATIDLSINVAPNTTPADPKIGTENEFNPVGNATISHVSTKPPPETIRPENYYHQLALVAFFVCGPNPFKKVADALAEMKILSDPNKRADFLTACENNPAIKHQKRIHIFKLATKIFYAPWMDEILSESQQKELCRMVNAVPTDRSDMELLVISAISAFRIISAFWLSTHLLRTGFIHTQEQRQAVFKICSAENSRTENNRFISQCGKFGDQVMFSRAAHANLHWTTAILSLKEKHKLLESKQAQDEKHQTK